MFRPRSLPRAVLALSTTALLVTAGAPAASGAQLEDRSDRAPYTIQGGGKPFSAQIARSTDAGYVTVDVEDPASPRITGDSTFNGADPLTGGAPPEGNGHQASSPTTTSTSWPRTRTSRPTGRATSR